MIPLAGVWMGLVTEVQNSECSNPHKKCQEAAKLSAMHQRHKLIII